MCTDVAVQSSICSRKASLFQAELIVNKEEVNPRWDH